MRMLWPNDSMRSSPDFIQNGPTADEVQRVATRDASSRIAGLEQVGGFGGKAVALAQGELYSDDPSSLQKGTQPPRFHHARASQGSDAEMADAACCRHSGGSRRA